MIQLNDRFFFFSDSLRSIEIDWPHSNVTFAYDGGTLRPASATASELEELRGLLNIMAEDFRRQIRIKHDDLDRYVAIRARAEVEEPT